MKISLHIIVLIVRGCFDRTHRLNELFLHLMRALCLCLINEPSRIFPCILLTRNHMIFLLQFGINKRLLIFSKTTNCTRPIGSCNFVSLWKNLLALINSKLHSKLCDYLYCTPLSSITIMYLCHLLLCLMTNFEALARAPKLGAKSIRRRQLIKSHINWRPNREKKKKEYESDLGGYEHYLSRSIHINFLIKPRFTDMISYIHSK